MYLSPVLLCNSLLVLCIAAAIQGVNFVIVPPPFLRRADAPFLRW